MAKSVFLSQSVIASDILSSTPEHNEGQLFWDAESHTYAVHGDIQGTSLQIGQEQWLRVIANENISNGVPVYLLSGSNSSEAAHIAIAEADGTGTKYNVIGISTHYISSGSEGFVTTFGKIHDLDLSEFNSGDKLYLQTSSGHFTNILPSNPYEKVPIGYVLNNISGSSILLVDIAPQQAISYPFVGVTELPLITSLGAGSFSVGNGKANLCTTSTGGGIVKNYIINSASFTLNTSSLLDAQHIVVNYNSGSPEYQLITDRSSIDEIQTTIVYTLTPGAGGSISQIDYDDSGNLLANKLLKRIDLTNGVERSSGFLLTETGSKGISISNGVAWIGPNEVSLDEVNSSGSRFILLAHSASQWSGSFINGAINNYVDNGTNLVPLSNNKFVVNYIYRGIGSLNSSIVKLSPEYATLSEAQASQPPPTPAEFSEISFLVGRMIYQDPVNTAVQVDSAFVQNFTPSGITDHNDLTGLQGGTTDEYYHLPLSTYNEVSHLTTINTTSTNYILTSTQHTLIVTGSSAVTITLPSSSLVHGKSYILKNRNAQGMYVRTPSNERIDGNLTLTSSFINSSIYLQCSGSEWFIL